MESPKGEKIDWANCKCPVLARLVDVQSPKTTSVAATATTTEAPFVASGFDFRQQNLLNGADRGLKGTRGPEHPPTPPPPTSLPPMPSLPPLPPFRSSVDDLEGKIRGITNPNSGQGMLEKQ